MLLLTTRVPHETPSDHVTKQHNNSQCLNDETPSTSSSCQNTHSKDMCASIISKLLGSDVPNTVVLSTSENLEEFVGDLIFRTNKTGTYEQVPINDKFIYIPILKTLQFIFKNEHICKMMQTCTQCDKYEDFCDGSYFKSHPLFSNAKKYGTDEILQPLVKDLKILETTGVAVPFAEVSVRGTLAQITGDNLDIQSILGFLESFSANNIFAQFINLQLSQFSQKMI
ncbi:hypothetical protein N1851_010909 [Merluccius polli]|uniref:Uncharacterized protein n=1 Tax=Merluccius polli TaxID=89951 RepID=A0AA47MYS7_MERPO|nr:hypothetical protein N1851_010909 [Merluccius polli]